MSKLSLRIASAVTASAIAFAGGAAMSPVAFAQEVGAEPTPTAVNTNTDLIDANAPVSLTINKYLGDPGDTSTPLSGITFRVERVNNVDLTTQAGWAAAADLTAATATDVTQVADITTGTDGVATISTGSDSAFTVGLYKVTELQAGNYTAAPPFLVALPHSENGIWSYDQVVNPKNQEIVASKQVQDTGVTIGDNLTYTVNAPVPAGEIDRFNIVDPLVTGLTYVEGSGQVGLVGGPADASLDAATDYQIVNDSANNTVRVEFTPAGRDKLEGYRLNSPGLKVTFEFQATVNEIPADGNITNTADIQLPNGIVVNTNGDDPSTTDVVEDNPTSTTFGNLTITKTTSNGTEPLNGAQFELYQCTVENGTPTLVGDPLNVKPAGEADRTHAVTSGGVDAGDATATVNNIPVSSFAAETGSQAIQYCVLETEAPAGYVRNPEPQIVNSVGGDIRNLAVSVDNQKNSIIGQLPATGAWGILLIFLLGLALLARGLYTSYKDSRATA